MTCVADVELGKSDLAGMQSSQGKRKQGCARCASGVSVHGIKSFSRRRSGAAVVRHDEEVSRRGAGLAEEEEDDEIGAALVLEPLRRLC